MNHELARESLVSNSFDNNAMILSIEISL